MWFHSACLCNSFELSFWKLFLSASETEYYSGSPTWASFPTTSSFPVLNTTLPQLQTPAPHSLWATVAQHMATEQTTSELTWGASPNKSQAVWDWSHGPTFPNNENTGILYSSKSTAQAFSQVCSFNSIPASRKRRYDSLVTKSPSWNRPG